ncbi:MAG TPA: DUF4136 domain-containing protein [Polyangiales bacterium]|nr:DUF4136 domain-containing protein [Polyangiales bacterium]
MSLLPVSACDCDDDDLPPDEVYARAKRGVDFTQYETFRIDDDLSAADFPDAGVDPEDLPDEVRFNIDIANDQARLELEHRGLSERKDGEDADLVIASLGSREDENAFYWDCVPGYWWGYWGWYWDNCAWIDPVYVEYSIGTVVVGLGDPKQEDIVFGGFVQGIGYGGSRDELELRIRAGVHEMFEDYYPVDAQRDASAD